MQNFGNYNVNPNTPIYVGGGKKKVKKQSEDKSLGEKVAIGVASTAGAIAAILIGYGIINKFTGNTTKITQDAKKAAEAVVPKAKGAEKKTADIIKGKDSSTQSTYVLLKNYVQQLQGGNMTYEDIKTNAIILSELAKKSNITEHGVDLLPLVKQYSRFFSTLLDTYKNQKSTDTVKLNNAENASLDKIKAKQTPLLEQIENIIALNNFFENFKLEDIEITSDDKLKCNNMTTDSLGDGVTISTEKLHEVCKKGDYTFYLDYADDITRDKRVNENAFLYINKGNQYTKIQLSTIKDKLNQVTEVDEFITTLDGFSIGELKFIPKGRKKQNTSDEPVPCLTGFTKDSDKKSYAIKLDDLLKENAKQLKALIQKDTDEHKKLTGAILSEIFKCATSAQLYQLMNDADWKDKLVTSGDSPTLTEVGKEIVGAAIKDKDAVDSGKIVTMLKEIKDLDTKGSVGAAVVNYLIGCGNVTADMLNQVMINEDLKDKLVKSNELTDVGKKIVDAAIKDNGTVTSKNIVQMLNGLDLKEEVGVGAAVVDHLIGRDDVTEDMLYDVLTSEGMMKKLTTTVGDTQELTEAGKRIMNKATEKGLTFEQLLNISRRNSKLVFNYDDNKKSFNIKDGQLFITNLPRTMFYYLQQQQKKEKDLTLETILFKQYLSAAGISACIDESGELKSLGDWDDSYVNDANKNSQAKYNPSELLVNHYVDLVKNSTDSEVKKALEDDASFVLQTPTTSVSIR